MQHSNDTQAHKQAVRDYFSRVNSGDISGSAAFVAEDVVNHAAVPEAQGRAGMVRLLEKLREAFPDMNYTCEDLVAEGDRVVARVTMRGTHTGRLGFVRMPLEPTGRAVQTEQVHVFRFAGGVVAEHWAGRDDFGMLRQLGVLERVARP
jgi:predicted ester cyclase